MLVGVFLIGYGLARFTVEFFREPDAQLVAFAARTGLHMGQWLTLPMFIGGFYLITTAGRRAPRLETRSEEHTSELQSLMRTSYAVFCLKKTNNTKNRPTYIDTLSNT